MFVKKMSEFVSADISLAYGAVQYICDFNFTHIKVEDLRDPISGTTKVLSVPIFFNVTYCSSEGHDHEKILFGRNFPHNLPVFLFKNKKQDDKIEFVYNNTRCTFTLKQENNSFEEALSTAFRRGIKYAKDDDKDKIRLVAEEYNIRL